MLRYSHGYNVIYFRNFTTNKPSSGQPKRRKRRKKKNVNLDARNCLMIFRRFRLVNLAAKRRTPIAYKNGWMTKSNNYLVQTVWFLSNCFIIKNNHCFDAFEYSWSEISISFYLMIVIFAVCSNEICVAHSVSCHLFCQSYLWTKITRIYFRSGPGRWLIQIWFTIIR